MVLTGNTYYQGDSLVTAMYQGDVLVYNLPGSMAYFRYKTNDGNPVVPYVTKPFGSVTTTHSFSGNTGVYNIYLSSGSASLGQSAFYDVTNITEANLENFQSVGAMAFKNCSRLSGVSLNSEIATIGESAFEASGIVSLSVPGGGSWPPGYGPTIPIKMCDHCGNLTSVTISDRIKEIKYSAFTYCQNLVSIEGISAMSYWNLSVADYAFYGCSKLTSVGFLRDNMYSEPAVHSIGAHAFHGCNIESIYIGEYTRYIDPTAFRECRNLSAITVYYENEYYWDGNGHNVLIKDGKIILGCKTSNLYNAGNTIGESAFYANSITSVTIPSSIRTVESFAFYGSDLQSLVIESGVSISGQDVFGSCHGLTSVTINQGVYLGEDMFDDCSNLNDITFNGTKAQWNDLDKDTDWNWGLHSAVIHCTDGDIPIW